MVFVNLGKENEPNRLQQNIMRKVNTQLLVIEYDLTGSGGVKVYCSCYLSFQIYLQIHVRQYSVALTLFVWRSTESWRVCASLNTLAIRTWRVGQSAFSTLTARTTVPASTMCVQIHVQERVALVPCVSVWITFQSASAHLRWLGIHLSPVIHLGLVWNTFIASEQCKWNVETAH
jgi:hypothetical protein